MAKTTMNQKNETLMNNIVVGVNAALTENSGELSENALDQVVGGINGSSVACVYDSSSGGSSSGGSSSGGHSSGGSGGGGGGFSTIFCS